MQRDLLEDSTENRDGHLQARGRGHQIRTAHVRILIWTFDSFIRGLVDACTNGVYDKDMLEEEVNYKSSHSPSMALLDIAVD
jgi:hypothetical protein